MRMSEGGVKDMSARPSPPPRATTAVCCGVRCPSVRSSPVFPRTHADGCLASFAAIRTIWPPLSFLYPCPFPRTFTYECAPSKTSGSDTSDSQGFCEIDSITGTGITGYNARVSAHFIFIFFPTQTFVLLAYTRRSTDPGRWASFLLL